MREPMPNDRYRDKRGQFVTVKACAFNRVEYICDGFPSACVIPITRFVSEFVFIGRASA